MKFKFILLILLLLVSTACGSDAEETTPVPETEEAASESPAETEEAASESPAETEEAAPEVKAEALTNLNLRQGPGTNYGVVGSLPEKSKIIIIGRNADGSWLQAETEEGQQVWLSGDPELVSVDSTLVTDLPVAEVEAAPLAYDPDHPKVHDILHRIPLVIHHTQRFSCGSHGGLNNILPEVSEGHVLGPHANDFVWVDKGNVLFKRTGGTFVLINENPIARFDNDAETLPLNTALQMFESGEIVWNGDFGQEPGRGVTGCDETP